MITLNCRFCRSFAAPIAQRALCDRPIFESENFVCIPSIGALIEGWVLLVPKAHFLCVGAMHPDLIAELTEFKDHVVVEIEIRHGDVALFEHGPASPSTPVGCGVDHAHLHVVPCQFDLAAAARREMNECIEWNSVSALSSTAEFHQSGLPYLYLEQPVGYRNIAVSASIPSQLFRKAIARHVGLPDAWNWQHFPFDENVSQTVHRLHGQGIRPQPLGSRREVVANDPGIAHAGLRAG